MPSDPRDLAALVKSIDPAIRTFIESQDGRALLKDVIRELIQRFGLSPFEAGRAIADYALERAGESPEARQPS